MSWSLAAPGALLLSLLVIGPLLAHLIRRHPQRREAFGAMMLLRRMERLSRRRRKLQDWLLLLLRMLVLILLALAAARPQHSEPRPPPELGGTGRVVILLDNSLSMWARAGGTPVGVEASAEALRVLGELDPSTEVGLITLGGSQAESLSEEWLSPSAAASLVAGVQIGFGATDLRGGLVQARRLLGRVPGEILILSDEAGPLFLDGIEEEVQRLSTLGHAILPQRFSPDSCENLRVIRAEYGDGLEGGTLTATVANLGSSPAERLVTLRLPGDMEYSAFLEIQAGSASEVVFTVPPEVPEGLGEVEVEDPLLPEDNVFTFYLPRVGADRVLVVDGDPGSTPIRSEVYFLERALAPGSSQLSPEVVAPASLVQLDMERHRVVFVANVGSLERHLGRLTDFVRAGGGLVFSLGSNVTAEAYRALEDLLPAPLRQLKVEAPPASGQGAQLELPDTRLELFQPFARGGRSAFGRVHTQTLMTLGPPPPGAEVQTLLRYQGGQPALMERKIGKGSVLMWTSTLDDAWTDLPLQALYTPLIQRMVSYLGGVVSQGRSASGVSGERVDFPSPSLEEGSLKLTGPGGLTYPLERPKPETLSFVPQAPGGYLLGMEGSSPAAYISINPSEQEADICPGEPLLEVQSRVDPKRYLKVEEWGWLALTLAGLSWLLLSLLARRSAEEQEEREQREEAVHEEA